MSKDIIERTFEVEALLQEVALGLPQYPAIFDISYTINDNTNEISIKADCYQTINEVKELLESKSDVPTLYFRYGKKIFSVRKEY